MKIEFEILINRYGQELLSVEDVLEQLKQSFFFEKKMIGELLQFILQSRPVNDDIDMAIERSGLKSTFTPCIILKKGVDYQNLLKIANLPDNESEKVWRLLLSLFQICYKRRYDLEKNSPHKWWYWDLADKKNVDIIRNTYNY